MSERFRGGRRAVTTSTLLIGFHLAFGTRRWGVNGVRRESFDSIWRRPLFGFGWSLAWQPWRWNAAWRVIRLRMSIAGLL
jgi:hypothetical protein